MEETKYKQTEVGLIPEEWESFRIDDLFDIGNGYTPSKANPLYWTNGTIPWFRLEDIRKNGRILNDSIQHITPLAVKNDKLFPSGSFILSTSATIGEHALITVASLANQRFCFLLKKPIIRDVFDTMYIFHYLYIIGDWCRNNINIGGLNAVNIDDLKNYELVVPSSLAEQHAIASALTSIDNLIASLDKLIAKTQSVKQGAMQQLFTGLNAKDVTWKPLYECLGYEQPARYIVKSSDYYDAGVPVLTAGQSFILGYTKETDGVFEASRECPVIIFDDFTTSFHWVEFKFKVKSSAMKMLRPISKDISFKYVHYAMNCINYEPVEHSRQWISMYSKFTIPIPSMDTQHRIASALSVIDDQISALEAKRKKYEMVKVGMMQQLLTGKIRLS